MKPGLSLAVLGERQFRLLFVGQSVSLLGDGIVGVALAFAVLGLTGSPSDLGFVLAARAASTVVFVLVGGVIADRLSRRAVMVTADLARVASQGLTAALLLADRAEVWQLAALQVVSEAATAAFYPGLAPATVSPARLQQANALRGLAGSAGEIAGPAIAGALVATVGAGWALAADAATFAFSALALALLRVAPGQRAGVQPFLRELRDG